MVTPLQVADAFLQDKILPAAGGLVDQTVSFIQFANLVRREDAAVRKEASNG